MAGPSLDAFVTRHVLAALEPAALELSLAAAEQVEHDRAAVAQLWEQRRERAAYETDRAARQYHAVEPENRLVARTLERAWEEQLRAQQTLEEAYHRFLQQQPQVLTAEEREAIRQLAADIPALWSAATTTDADRKAIIRQVVEQVAVEAQGTSEQVQVRITWAGGGQTEGVLVRPIARYSDRSDYARLCTRVQDLTHAGWSLEAMAHQLETDGFPALRSRQDWSVASVQTLRHQLGLGNTHRHGWPANWGSRATACSPGSSTAWCGHARRAAGGSVGSYGPMRRSWSACKGIATAMLPPNSAVAGRQCPVSQHTRKGRPHDGHKSSNRS